MNKRNSSPFSPQSVSSPFVSRLVEMDNRNSPFANGKEYSPSMKSEKSVLVIDEKPSGKKICGVPVSLFSGAAYCMASMGMVSGSLNSTHDTHSTCCDISHLTSLSSLQVLLNKMALSSFNFKAANALLFFQCALCVVAVHLCSQLRLIKLEPFNFEVARVW